MSQIHPLRDYWERHRLRTEWTQPNVQGSVQPTADPRCRFRRAPGEEWTFDGQSILLNGRDVTEMLEPGEGEIGAWCGLVEALGEYRDWAYAQQALQLAKLQHVAGGLQERALVLLQRVYAEKMGGLSFSWGDGQFFLNNINIRAMLAMYHARPTARARQFLEGLREKLALILRNQTASPQQIRVQDVVRDVYDEVCTSLAAPAVDRLCLPLGDRNRCG